MIDKTSSSALRQFFITPLEGDPMLNESSTLTRLFNHGFSYWLYGLMGILAAWFVLKLVPETKGRTLEEIEKFWKAR